MNIKLRNNLKNVILELYGKYRIRRSRKNEINKISDQRRQDILGKVHLTED